MDSFTEEFYQTYKEKLIILFMLILSSQTTQNTREAETFPNSFYKATITLIPKLDEDTTKKTSQHP